MWYNGDMKRDTPTKKSQFTVYIEQDEDGIFIGSIPSLPSCYAQGGTQEEMMTNLQEVVRLCMRNRDDGAGEHTTFVGVQNIEMVHT